MTQRTHRRDSAMVRAPIGFTQEWSACKLVEIRRQEYLAESVRCEISER